MKRVFTYAGIVFCILITGYLLPERITIPVSGATQKDWHPESFWYYPWGKSGVHRGVDIFAVAGRPVLTSTSGIVVSTAIKKQGGKTVTVLGAKWLLHYYAHLDTIDTRRGKWVDSGDKIGTVGTSGNAVGKTPHLHYSIRTIIPYLWRADESHYGSQKKWYINPIPRLTQSTHE